MLLQKHSTDFHLAKLAHDAALAENGCPTLPANDISLLSFELDCSAKMAFGTNGTEMAVRDNINARSCFRGDFAEALAKSLSPLKKRTTTQNNLRRI